MDPKIICDAEKEIASLRLDLHHHTPMLAREAKAYELMYKRMVSFAIPSL